MELTRSQLEDIIRTAFEHGTIWAETYKSWFTPTPEQTEAKIQEAVKELL